jgi:hypothetical protein
MQKESSGMPQGVKGQDGVSLIAAIFIIVVLAFMGLMFLSLITTGSLTAVNDMQSTQALSIAEGGVEFHQLNLARNLDWYRSATDPISTDIRNLGAGSFTVSTTLPATKLKAQVTFASVAPLRVYSVARFLTSGCLRIEDEFITYGSVGTTAGACNPYQPPCFTGIVRGGGSCFGGGTQSAHSRGDTVFPVSTLGTSLPNNCNDIASLTITRNDKLLSAGTLDIQGEAVSYTGSSTVGVTTTLTGIQRCLNATPNVSGSGFPVTPVLDSAAWQAEIVSTGAVGAAVRTVKNTVER